MTENIDKYSIEPSNEEINSSVICKQIIDKYNEIANLKIHDPDFQQKFNYFINDLLLFLKEEKNKKLSEYFGLTMIQYCIETTIKFKFNDSLLTIINDLFNGLDLLLKNSTTIPFKDFILLFIYIVKYYQNEKNKDEESNSELILNALKSNITIFSILFSNESFFNDFIGQDLFLSTFKIIYFDIGFSEICIFYHNIIFSNAPRHLIMNLDLQTLFTVIIYELNIYDDNQNKDQSNTIQTHGPNYEQISIFISNLISINKQYNSYFNDASNFKILSKLLNASSFDVIVNCFQNLLFTVSGTNFSVLENIYCFYKDNPQIHQKFFTWYFKLIESRPEILNQMNKTIPFPKWIVPQIPFRDLLMVLQIFIKKIDSKFIANPEFISHFFGQLLKILCENEVELESYFKCIEIIESQILHHHISLAFLYDSFFLKGFIMQPSIDTLNNIFQRSYTFPQLVYDVYALPEAKPSRQEVLGKIIEVASHHSESTSIISAFFVISDSNKNIRDLMTLIETSKNSDLCNIFANAFDKSEILTQKFLQENGIKWIDKIHNEKIINDEVYISLLSNLAVHSPVKKVDKYLDSFQKNNIDNPLFLLDRDHLKEVIYGYSDPKNYYPIKIHSVFHFLEWPKKIDKYNASIIGKYVLKKLINNPKSKIFELPIINDIINTYVSDKVLFKIIDEELFLDEFIDKTNDHFPLFQVFEFTDEHIFEFDFKTISFWFKFEKSINESLKVPIFHVGKFQIFYKNNFLLANYDGIQYEVSINPLQWNHIAISVSSQRASHKIKIWVNMNKASFPSPAPLNHLSNYGFVVYASLLYLGPAIRLYQQKKSDEIKEIFMLGPSSMKSLNEDIIITPFSNFPLSENILPVEYNGIPQHFLSRKKREYFFHALKTKLENNNIEKAHQMINFFFKVYEILQKQELFNELLTFLTFIPNTFVKDTFLYILSIFGNVMDKKSLLYEVLQHKILWETISNDILVFSLVSYFKTFDFLQNSLEEFQMFLIQLSIKNSKSKFLITTLLVNMLPLPKVKKCLSQLFISHHLMEFYFDKQIQCGLPYGYQAKNLVNYEEIFENNDKRDVCIQCEIIQPPDDTNQNYSYIDNYDDHLLLFQNFKNTDLQFNIADCIIEFIDQTKKFDQIKSFLPYEDLISLFIISNSNNLFKSKIFTIFTLIEENSPGYIQTSDYIFLISIIPLYTYQSVWDNIMALVTDDGKTIKSNLSNSPFLPNYLKIILILIWALTVASLNCVLIEGKDLISILKNGKEYITNYETYIQFCVNNSKYFSQNKSCQNIFRTLFSFLFGRIKSTNDDLISPIKIDNVEIFAPKITNFSIFYIYKQILESANLTQKFKNNSNTVFYNSQFKTIRLSDVSNLLHLNKNEEDEEQIQLFSESPENYFIDAFISFLNESSLVKFIINFIMNSNETDFPDMIAPFLLSSSNSMKILIESFIATFFHLILVEISENLLNNKNYGTNIQFFFHLIPIIHYFNHFNLIFKFIERILSDIFYIMKILNQNSTKSIIIGKNRNLFKKVSKAVHPLLCDILSAFDSNNYDIMISVLQSNVSIFSEILVTTNNTDLYLRFFQKISPFFCYNEINTEKFDIFLDLLSNTLRCGSNKVLLERILEIKKHEKSQDKNLLANWIKCLELFNSVQIGIQSLKSENYKLMMSKLKEITEAFSLTYYISKKRQNSLCLSLFAGFEEISYIQNSKKNYQDFIIFHLNKCQDDTSQFKRYLLMNYSPIMFPYIHSPLFFDSQADVLQKLIKSFHLYSKNSLKFICEYFNKKQNTKSFFLSSEIAKENQSQNKIITCNLERLDTSIPCMLIISSKNLYIFPFCSNKFTGINENVLSLLCDILNGQWGKTSLYDTWISIKIPIYSILLISKKSTLDPTNDKIKTNILYVFWTMMSGSFILSNINNKIDEELIDKINYYSNPLALNRKLLTIETVISKWKSNLINSVQMLLALNIINDHYFVSSNSPILLPQNRIFDDNNINDFVIQEFHIDKRLLGLKHFKSEYFICESKHQILYQKFFEKVTINTVFGDSLLIYTLPFNSFRISQFSSFYLIIDKGSLKILIIYFDERKYAMTSSPIINDIYNSQFISIIYSKSDNMFGNISNINISENGNFFSLDFECGITHIYRIIYSNNYYHPTKCLAPSGFEIIKEISLFKTKSKTFINGNDMMCLTYANDQLYLSPFYREGIHISLNLNSNKIKFAQFDDNIGVFIVCTQSFIYLFDINGNQVIQNIGNSSSLQTPNIVFQDKEITAFHILQLPISEEKRCAIIGFHDGSVAFVSYNFNISYYLEKAADEKIKELAINKTIFDKVHDSKVIKIIAHPSKYFILTIDECDNMIFWTMKREIFNDESYSSINIDFLDNSICPKCSSKSHTFCLSCKRTFCSNCLNSEHLCSDCL